MYLSYGGKIHKRMSLKNRVGCQLHGRPGYAMLDRECLLSEASIPEGGGDVNRVPAHSHDVIGVVWPRKAKSALDDVLFYLHFTSKEETNGRT